MTALSIPERARAFSQDWARKNPTGTLADLAESALHSERELCAKELEANASNRRNHRVQGEPCSLVSIDKVLDMAAKLLREGGQK